VLPAVTTRVYPVTKTFSKIYINDLTTIYALV